MNKEFSSTNIFTSCNETHFISEYFYSGENILIFLRPVSIRAGKEISVPIGEKVSGRNSPSFRSIESSRVPYRFIGFTRYPSSRFFFFFFKGWRQAPISILPPVFSSRSGDLRVKRRGASSYESKSYLARDEDKLPFIS